MLLPRNEYGSLRANTELGGYPFYYIDGDGSVLCPKCGQRSDEDPDEVPQFKPVGYGINWEDPCLFCDDCSERIPSAYAED
jgi:hypothetical protein